MAIFALAGQKGSGTSTVAYELARLLARERKAPAVYVAAFEQSNSQSARHVAAAWAKHSRQHREASPIALHLRQMRGLGPLTSLIPQAAGCPVVLDTRDALFTWEMGNYSAQSATVAERRDVRVRGKGPEDWMSINRLLRSMTVDLADTHDVDLIEVYKLGDVRRDGEEVDALKFRGDNQAGRSAGMVIEVTGGLKSDAERSVYVLSDVSGTLTGAREKLPTISGAGDLLELRRRLARMFEKPLGNLLRVADEDRAEWRRIFDSEPAWIWDEADRQGERDASTLLYGEIVGALKLAGLGGTDGASQQARIGLLRDHFGVYDLESLQSLALGRMQDGAETLRRALQDLETRKRILSHVAALLRRAGLEGRAADVIARRAQLFAQHFAVLAEEELQEMELESLQRRTAQLAATLFPSVEAEMSGEVTP